MALRDTILTLIYIYIYIVSTIKEEFGIKWNIIQNQSLLWQMLKSDLLFPARKERILVREKYSRSTHGFTPL